MMADVQGRLAQGDNITLALDYLGKTFTGYLQDISQNFITVKPTAKTIQRYNIVDSSNVKLPIDPTLLSWSAKTPNMLRGRAKETKSMDAQKTDWRSESPYNSGNNSNMGDKNDPSSWAIDMASQQIIGKPLTEYVSDLKEMKKKDQMSNSKTNNLVAKHARTYNKAAVHTDRKKDQKRGASKYKKDMYGE